MKRNFTDREAEKLEMMGEIKQESELRETEIHQDKGGLKEGEEKMRRNYRRMKMIHRTQGVREGLSYRKIQCGSVET